MAHPGASVGAFGYTPLRPLQGVAAVTLADRISGDHCRNLYANEVSERKLPDTMRLHAVAQHLTHQFIRLLVCVRKVLEFLPGSMRDSKAARTRPAADTRTVAIHEAGHTVLLIALGLAFSAVSIVPDVSDGSAGRVYLARWDRAADLRTLPREAVYLRHAMVSYAGAEAVRQLIPTHPDPDSGASQDNRDAAEFISHHIGSDAGSMDLLFSLAKRRCALLVEHYQPEIQALAGALEMELILSAKDARSVFMRSLTGRAGPPLTFKSDPTLNPLASDEVFRAFLRKLNLPPRAN